MWKGESKMDLLDLAQHKALLWASYYAVGDTEGMQRVGEEFDALVKRIGEMRRDENERDIFERMQGSVYAY